MPKFETLTQITASLCYFLAHLAQITDSLCYFLAHLAQITDSLCYFLAQLAQITIQTRYFQTHRGTNNGKPVIRYKFQQKSVPIKYNHKLKLIIIHIIMFTNTLVPCSTLCAVSHIPSAVHSAQLDLGTPPPPPLPPPLSLTSAQ